MKMSPSSWQVSLRNLLTQQTVETRIAIVGIGNTFRSDDGAGVLVARALMNPRLFPSSRPVLVMDAGHAPENATGELRRFAPDIVLLIDAVDMGEAPGAIRWIDTDEIEGMSASTHSLPLSMVARYLNWELKCDVTLLGIQLRSNEVGETVSAEVFGAVESIVGVMKEASRQSQLTN
jgi:hydrogenase 3 maturation protease